MACVTTFSSGGCKTKKLLGDATMDVMVLDGYYFTSLLSVLRPLNLRTSKAIRGDAVLRVTQEVLSRISGKQWGRFGSAVSTYAPLVS